MYRWHTHGTETGATPNRAGSTMSGSKTFSRLSLTSSRTWRNTARLTGRLSSDRKVVPLGSGDFGKPVFCVLGLGRLDDCGVLVVADALKREGINARVAAAVPTIKDEEAGSICLCYLENISRARLDYAVRKLSRSAPAARIVVCLFTGAGRLSSASEQGPEPPRSLKATIAAFANPESRSGSVVGN
jgi:hypothetical protein